MLDDFNVLKKYENIVFDNLDSFTSKFCHGYEVFDVYGIHFSSESVNLHYILDGDSLGQHVSDTIKLTEFIKWIEELNNDKN